MPIQELIFRTTLISLIIIISCFVFFRYKKKKQFSLIQFILWSIEVLFLLFISLWTDDEGAATIVNRFKRSKRKTTEEK